ncbi:hypothetical protein QTN25_002909 [Entamoeba marina]
MNETLHANGLPSLNRSSKRETSFQKDSTTIPHPPQRLQITPMKKDNDLKLNESIDASSSHKIPSNSQQHPLPSSTLYNRNPFSTQRSQQDASKQISNTSNIPSHEQLSHSLHSQYVREKIPSYPTKLPQFPQKSLSSQLLSSSQLEINDNLSSDQPKHNFRVESVYVKELVEKILKSQTTSDPLRSSASIDYIDKWNTEKLSSLHSERIDTSCDIERKNTMPLPSLASRIESVETKDKNKELMDLIGNLDDSLIKEVLEFTKKRLMEIDNSETIEDPIVFPMKKQKRKYRRRKRVIQNETDKGNDNPLTNGIDKVDENHDRNISNNLIDMEETVIENKENTNDDQCQIIQEKKEMEEINEMKDVEDINDKTMEEIKEVDNVNDVNDVNDKTMEEVENEENPTEKEENVEVGLIKKGETVDDGSISTKSEDGQYKKSKDESEHNPITNNEENTSQVKMEMIENEIPKFGQTSINSNLHENSSTTLSNKQDITTKMQLENSKATPHTIDFSQETTETTNDTTETSYETSDMEYEDEDDKGDGDDTNTKKPIRLKSRKTVKKLTRSESQKLNGRLSNQRKKRITLPKTRK